MATNSEKKSTKKRGITKVMASRDEDGVDRNPSTSSCVENLKMRESHLGQQSITDEEADDELEVEENSSNEDAISRTFHEENDGRGKELLLADFEFLDPEEDDFHAIKILLQNSGLYEFLPLSEVADCICNQGNIGTCVKTPTDIKEESGSVVGFMTILNCHQFEQLLPLQNYLLPICKKYLCSQDYQRFEGLMLHQSEMERVGLNMGLFISERFINLPSSLVPLMHEVVVDDVVWSQETPEMPEDERPHYFFDYILCITRVFKPLQAPSSEVLSGKKRAKKASNISSEDLIFYKFEDEILMKNASLYFAWPTGKTMGLLPEEASQSRQSMGKRHKKKALPIKKVAHEEFVLVYLMSYKAFAASTSKLKRYEPLDDEAKVHRLGK